jgi:hypothetical protein
LVRAGHAQRAVDYLHSLQVPRHKRLERESQDGEAVNVNY